MPDAATMASILEEHVCPVIGAILSTLTFAAPIRTLAECLKDGDMKSVNGTPWIFMTGNTIGWLAYSYVTLDIYVFLANAPGLMISIWLNFGAMKLQYYQEAIKDLVEDGAADSDSSQQQNERKPSLTKHEARLLLMVLTWMLILSVTTLKMEMTSDRKQVIGIAVNINLVFFYGAPLSSMLTVIKTRSSASIHFLTMAMNTVNAFFWCVYSLAIQDYYILIPNGLGLLFGMVQLLLYSVFPRSAVETDGTEEQFIREDDDAVSRSSVTEIT
mmetsp:Transcript_17365/g.40385  ORF Transcript_17365/g.40385 Transcript_17365/m.40385 type:complete len:272 (-) Transcript_17365:200-1015(-)